MGRITLGMILLLTLIGVGGGWAAERGIPHGIAGVELDHLVTEFQDLLDMDSALVVRFQEYLAEVEFKPLAGIKTALAAYGTCANPGRIVRIKIKYADSSRRFFDRLLSQCKERFGNPMEWRGDPFHVMIAWKWSFVDEKGNRISLTLQHNTQDRDQKMGNAIKLNLNNGIEEERACLQAKLARSRETQNNALPKSNSRNPDWDLLIPQ